MIGIHAINVDIANTNTTNATTYSDIIEVVGEIGQSVAVVEIMVWFINDDVDVNV